MNHTTYRSIPERVGHCLGRGWRAAARAERRASNWMVARGAPKGFVVVLLWVAKLVAAGVMLYLATGIAVLMLFAGVAAWVARNAEPASTPEPEWRNGPTGFGLYTYDGFRIDPHVVDDD